MVKILYVGRSRLMVSLLLGPCTEDDCEFLWKKKILGQCLGISFQLEIISWEGGGKGIKHRFSIIDYLLITLCYIFFWLFVPIEFEFQFKSNWTYKNENQQFKGKFQFLLHTLAFFTLITPFNKFSSAWPHLEKVLSVFTPFNF